MYVILLRSQPKWFVPRGVNLIGEHTDYNDGFVLPCAIDFGTYIAFVIGRIGWPISWPSTMTNTCHLFWFSHPSRRMLMRHGPTICEAYFKYSWTADLLFRVSTLWCLEMCPKVQGS